MFFFEKLTNSWINFSAVVYKSVLSWTQNNVWAMCQGTEKQVMDRQVSDTCKVWSTLIQVAANEDLGERNSRRYLLFLNTWFGWNSKQNLFRNFSSVSLCGGAQWFSHAADDSRGLSSFIINSLLFVSDILAGDGPRKCISSEKGKWETEKRPTPPTLGRHSDAKAKMKITCSTCNRFNL